VERSVHWLQHSARPALRQNTADFELDYGLLWQGLELSLESPVIAIVSVQRHCERSTVAGFGDTNVGLKYEFVEEQPDDPWPALAASLNLEFPTGSTRQGLGSGLIDLSSRLPRSVGTSTTRGVSGPDFAWTACRRLVSRMWLGSRSGMADFHPRQCLTSTFGLVVIAQRDGFSSW
jgi:hypothetical protein